MIHSFKDRETERLWNRERSRRFQKVERQARMKLDLLDAIIIEEDVG